MNMTKMCAALHFEAKALEAIARNCAGGLRGENFDGVGECGGVYHSERGLLLLLLLLLMIMMLLQKHRQHLFTTRPTLRIHIHRLRAMQMQIPV